MAHRALPASAEESTFKKSILRKSDSRSPTSPSAALNPMAPSLPAPCSLRSLALCAALLPGLQSVSVGAGLPSTPRKSMRAINDSPPRARPGSLPAAGSPMLGCLRLTSHFRFAPRALLGTVGGFSRDGTSPPASWGVVALSVAFLASSARSLRARRERLPHTAIAELHSGQRSGEMKQVAGVGWPCSFAHVWGGDGRGLVETAQAAKSSAATSAEVGRLRRIATRCQSSSLRRRLKSQARAKVQPRAPTWSRAQWRAWPTAAEASAVREVFSSRIHLV